MNPKTTQAIIKTRQSLNLDRDEWQNWTICLARLYLNAAPEEARLQFMGPSSDISPQAKELAEVFAMLFARAEDKAVVVGLPYSMVNLWLTAIQEARHG